MSAGLKRARRPYLVKNAVTGAILGAFAIGIWAYSIRAVKQDIFDDVDEEARVLAGTGATATMRSLEDDAKQSTKAKSEMVLGSGPTLVPPVTTKKETETEKGVVGRGVLVSLLDNRFPKLLDPKRKTLVWGAPPVDNIGTLSSRSAFPTPKMLFSDH